MEAISTQPKAGKCPGHFSMKQYVSGVRNVERKKCWPFPVKEIVEYLPPMTVKNFEYWKCKETQESSNPSSNGGIHNVSCSETVEDIPSHEAASMLLACSERAYKERNLEGKTASAHAPIHENSVICGPEEPAPQEENRQGQMANVGKSKLFGIDILIDSLSAVKERTSDGKTTDTGANADASAIDADVEIQEKEVIFVSEREGMYPSRDDELAAIKNNRLKGFNDDLAGNVNGAITKGKGKQLKDVKITRPRSKRPGVNGKNITQEKKLEGKTVLPTVSVDERPEVARKTVTKAKIPSGKAVLPTILADELEECDHDSLENDYVSLENEASTSRGNTRRRTKIRSLDDILKDAPLRVCEKASISNEESDVDHIETDSESNEENYHNIVETGCDSNVDSVADQVQTGSGSNGDNEFQFGSGSNREGVTERVVSESDDQTLGIDLNLSPTHQEVHIKRKFMQDEGSSKMNAAKKLGFSAPGDDQRPSLLAMKGKMSGYEERGSLLGNQQGGAQGHLRGTESPIDNSHVSSGKLSFMPLKKDGKTYLETGASSLGNQSENSIKQNGHDIPRKPNHRRNNRTSHQAASGSIQRDFAEILTRNVPEKQLLVNTGKRNCLPETMTQGVKHPDQMDRAEKARKQEVLRCLAEKRLGNHDRTQSIQAQPPEYVSKANCRPPLASNGLELSLNSSSQSEYFGRNCGFQNSMYPNNQVAALNGTGPFLFGQNPPFSKIQDKPSSATDLPLGNPNRACGSPNSPYMKTLEKSAPRTQYPAASSGLGNQNPAYSQPVPSQNSLRGDQPGWTPMITNCLPFGTRNPTSAKRSSKCLDLFPNESAHPLANPLDNNHKKNSDMAKRQYQLPNQVREVQMNPPLISPNMFNNGNMTTLLRLVHAGVNPNQPINLDTASPQLSFAPSLTHLSQPETPRSVHPPPSKHLNRNHRPTKTHAKLPSVPVFNPARTPALEDPDDDLMILEPEEVGNLTSISRPKKRFVSTPSQAPSPAIKNSGTSSLRKRQRLQEDSVNGICNLNQNPAELLMPENPFRE